MTVDPESGLTSEIERLRAERDALRADVHGPAGAGPSPRMAATDEVAVYRIAVRNTEVTT
jgi:hypothetical protein